MKFHVTEDGPKKCTASKRACPVGGDHFESLSEAAVAFEESMKDGSFKPLSRKIDFPISANVQEVVNRLSERGIKSLLVGGCVRDHLLGIESKDIDLELYGSKPDGSSLDFKDVKAAFPRKDGFKIDEAGASFSVLKVRYNKEDFDLALPRVEKSTGDHHRDYEVEHDSTMSFEEASTRRDFTINSIGFDPVEGKLVDPNNGVADLRANVLRHISEAFSDDPLRCMRAVNFASRFGSTVAPETLKLCQELAPSYSTLAHERVEEEFNKLFYKGDYCDNGLKVFYDIGWSAQTKAFSGLSREQLDSYGKILNHVEKGPLRKLVLSRLMIQEGAGDPTTFIESSSKGRTFIHSVNKLYDAMLEGDRGAVVASHRGVKKKFPEYTNKQLKDTLEALGEDSHWFKKLPETPVESVVTGKRLTELGYAPGPEMGNIIKKAQSIQDSEALYDFEELLSRALKS